MGVLNREWRCYPEAMIMKTDLDKVFRALKYLFDILMSL